MRFKARCARAGRWQPPDNGRRASGGRTMQRHFAIDSRALRRRLAEDAASGRRPFLQSHQSQTGYRSGRGKSAEHQFARRSLLMRRMITTPSSDQSKLIAPPSWAAILRCTNWLPKPSSFVGATTGGPPRSVHLTTTSSSWALHDTSRVPLESDSAPYFAELVANSCNTRASAVLEASPTFILGTETRIRTLAPFSSYGASRTEMRSPRSVPSLFVLVPGAQDPEHVQERSGGWSAPG